MNADRSRRAAESARRWREISASTMASEKWSCSSAAVETTVTNAFPQACASGNARSAQDVKSRP